MLGKHYLNDFNETGSINSSLIEIILHPSWSNSLNSSYDADIAILVLIDPINFTDLIRPVCLPKQSFDEVAGVGVNVGWGQSQRNHFHDIKPNGLEIPVINSTHCFSQFPKLALISSDSLFCGGYANQGKSPCLGDSGGGLYFQVLENSPWIARGIVSSSLLDNNRQCNINAFQLYTNVARFVDWIDENVARTLKTDWNFVEFHCDRRHQVGLEIVCSHYHTKQWHKYMKFSTKFDQLENMVQLEIQFSPFDRIISGVGEVFQNLDQISITNQGIKELKADNFANMEKLKYLLLSRNKLKILKENVFDFLENLELLNLDGNQLEKLPTKIFYNQRKIITIHLSYNLLTHLDKEIFATNVELRSIWFIGNKLKRIDVDFTEFSDIKVLNLEKNDCINALCFFQDIQIIQEFINQNCTGSSATELTDETLITFICKTKR
jgi:Leucine-rich repeat (LRR) protein